MAIIALTVIGVFLLGLCVGAYAATKNEEKRQVDIASRDADLRARGWRR